MRRKYLHYYKARPLLDNNEVGARYKIGGIIHDMSRVFYLYKFPMVWEVELPTYAYGLGCCKDRFQVDLLYTHHKELLGERNVARQFIDASAMEKEHH